MLYSTSLQLTESSRLSSSSPTRSALCQSRWHEHVETKLRTYPVCRYAESLICIPGQAKTDTRVAFIIVDIARTMPHPATSRHR